jgi:hypothetical protein
MNWYKKAYNREIGYLNRYLREGFKPYDYIDYVWDFLEEIEHPIVAQYEEGVNINSNNLFNKNNLYEDDPREISEQWIYSASPEEIEEFKEWIGSQNLDVSRWNAPPYEAMDYTRFVKPTWLVHFTDYPNEISENGFEKGWEDYEGLSYTTFYSDSHSPGFNFAFDANDSRDIMAAANASKYGKHAVLFWGSGVESTHYGDQEDQIIVWGPSVNTNMIIPIINDGEEWAVMNNRYWDEYPMYSNIDINETIAWCINNIDMVRQTLGKWKPKKRISMKIGNWFKKAQVNSIMGQSVTVLNFETIESISYILYEGEQDLFIVVRDEDSEENIHVKRYPDRNQAVAEYQNAVNKARQYS